MKLYHLFFLFLIFLGSCKPAFLEQEPTIALASEPLPGTVGTYQTDMLSQDFTEVGSPHLQEKIRLAVQKEEFSKGNLRKFNRQLGMGETKLEIIDSVNSRPHYYIINISDKVGLIRELNASVNNNLRSYLESTGENELITSVKIYFPPPVDALLDEASEVYLISDKKSSYSLQLVSKDNSKKVIEFKEGTLFGYGFSSFCWTADRRYRPIIAAFRERNKPCPGNTKKDPGKVKSLDIFDKI